MTLTLILENAPHAQAEMRRSLEAGELTIGRDASADWQIDDPDKYVSRHHCTVMAENGAFTITDTSSGGLFVDGADRPLGAGNRVTLEQGMRLRMGDFVMRVDLNGAERPNVAPAPARESGAFTFDFGDAPAYEPEPERPADLPPRFRGSMATGGYAAPEPEKDPAAFRFDDPFTLEPERSPPARAPEPPQPAPGPTPPGGDYFSDFGAPGPEPAPDAPRMRERPAHPPARDDRPVQPPPPVAEPPTAEPPFAAPPPAVSPPSAPEPAAPASGPAPTAASDAALRAAFFRGLGIAPPEGAADPEAEMEALGARFRALTEGLMAMLRARSQEKQNVRVAQTVIGSADVNPLKFLATPTEGVDALVRPRGPGYLDPDAAIAAAYRDLADHQMRTWIAVQAALRRMVDRFDPAEIEKELSEMGLIETWLAGGRGAKLWHLYEQRYRDMAKSAEDRFLGEIGADFRQAYEDGQGR